MFTELGAEHFSASMPHEKTKKKPPVLLMLALSFGLQNRRVWFVHLHWWLSRVIGCAGESEVVSANFI